MIQTDKILFIPSLRKGNGTGHLKRCLDWAANFDEIHIFILKNRDEELLDYVNHPICSNYKNIVWHENPGSDWELIILDNRSSDSIPDFLHGIPLIAIDECGKIRDQASYVIDTLPSLHQKEMNTRGYRFIKRKLNSRSPDRIGKILVSFGGEDPGGLTTMVCNALKSRPISQFLQKSNIKVDIIVPSFKEVDENRDGIIRILPYVEGLSEKIDAYDLILCQYGLTAFEALSCSRCVLLINPGSYHDKLCKSAGLPYSESAITMNTDQFSNMLLNKLKQYNGSMEVTKRIHKNLWNQYSGDTEDLAEWLSTMNISSDICPVCGSPKRTVSARFENKSYFQCDTCKMKYMVQFRKEENIYTEDYFFSEYKKQYGKTYIEDFPHIQEMGRKRLQYISRLNPDIDNLLDIGCAYGPFLKAASDWGYKAAGLDISGEAVDYIHENFTGIRAFQGDLGKEETRKIFRGEEFSVITLWYVIEHFSDLKEILPCLNSLLKKDGVLALATPYASGVSRRCNEKQFYQNSPEDHYTLWDKKSARISLKRAGFKKIKFVSTGHHPERFSSGIKKIIPKKMLMWVSRILGWGDTFEIYALKG